MSTRIPTERSEWRDQRRRRAAVCSRVTRGASLAVPSLIPPLHLASLSVGRDGLRSHIVLMFLYSAATAAFFALIRSEKSHRDRVHFFVWVFIALFFGGIAVGWAMYPFPFK